MGVSQRTAPAADADGWMRSLCRSTACPFMERGIPQADIQIAHDSGPLQQTL